MKQFLSHHRWTICAVLAALLTLSAWIGAYVHWRKNSIAIGWGSGTYRNVFLPAGMPKFSRHIFLPLSQIDGWIHDETVTVRAHHPATGRFNFRIGYEF